MTEQEKFMAVETPEEAIKYIGKKIFSTDDDYPGVRKLIGWNSPRHWLTYRRGEGWSGKAEAKQKVGSEMEGLGNYYIDVRHLFLLTQKEIKEKNKHHKEILKEAEKKKDMFKIEQMEKEIEKIEEAIQEIKDKWEMVETVEVKPAIRQLDLDD